ncbi:sporulation phosphorelay system protein KapB [Paucisalibacillus sp. EB02]|uniref:sporulation phosphorelay system protein KapB n=1 Tax=Paucisalibacillus sp. EB02 TaxID=1347087 RepID=UPI0004B3431B|nr:sporulation phosphorelay system protein KapB [Paucisalibacillus sp. EB02]
MSELSIGDIVQAPNKSGIYIGELIEDRQDKYLVKVLAVLKHPMQGDLHHPKQVENVVFHERKALAHFEKVNVLKSVVNYYSEAVPEYGESLKSAVANYRKQLEYKATPYNQEALKALKIVEESYYLGKYY